ncbi:MAG: helix-turn-helix transcriptional regulator [Planctomycetota bacterium]|jgi:AraC-like DNA-binding protein
MREGSIRESDVYACSRYKLARFLCPVSADQFHDTGPVGSSIVVFPRTSVLITQAGHDPVVADMNTVMLYNPGQEYQRDVISREGDRSDYFWFPADILCDAIMAFDPGVEERPGSPFTMPSAPCDARLFAMQRVLFENSESGEMDDPLLHEELAMEVLRCTVESAYREAGVRPARTSTEQAHRQIVLATRLLLADTYHEAWSLAGLAREVHSSAYHLARIFRAQTGSSIASHIQQLRLRSSLERLASGGVDLSELAISLGFSSHSHYSHAFKRTFGVSPSSYRASPGSFAHLFN